MELCWDHKKCTVNAGKCKILVPEIMVSLYYISSLYLEPCTQGNADGRPFMIIFVNIIGMGC
jgi:hypothetical protein